MADTSYLSNEVREYVQDQLERRYGQEFRRRELGVGTGGFRTFDCVSEDGSIVAEIKTASGRTSSGKLRTGNVNATTVEVYFLSLLNVKTRLIILTDREFHEIYMKKMQGFLLPDIEIVLMDLPASMLEKVKSIKRKASREVGG